MTFDDLPLHLLSLTAERGCSGIVIDGDLCSGKTTIAKRLEEELKQDGKQVQRFCVDWFLAERDKRDYRNDPAMMDLSNWFDLEAAATILAHMLDGTVGRAPTFKAYDRLTGKRTLDATVTGRNPSAFLLIEGLYALDLMHGRNDLLCCFLTVPEFVGRERMLRRNTYIDRKRLLFEIENIYLPSLRKYRETIDAMDPKPLFIDTTN